LTLTDVAARTKIGTRMLAAIEREDFRQLPEGLFRRAYVKTFADALGLDGDAFAQAYVASFEPPAPPPVPEPSRWALMRRRPVVAAIALGTVCAALVTVIGLRSRQGTTPQGVPEGSFEVRQASLEEPSDVQGIPPEDMLSAPAADVDTTPLRVVIETSAECWVSAIADGERVIHRLVEADESVSISASSAVTIRLGNAGAVRLLINGTPARSLGTSGQVVTVDITPDNYHAMLAPAQRIAEANDPGQPAGRRLSPVAQGRTSHPAWPGLTGQMSSS